MAAHAPRRCCFLDLARESDRGARKRGAAGLGGKAGSGAGAAAEEGGKDALRISIPVRCGDATKTNLRITL